MGVAFPSGLRRSPGGAKRSGWVAHAWVLNGYASVAGSVVAMIVALALGFSAVLLAAAACYAVAAVVAWRWPVAEPAPRR
jgi:hypothetical protein